MQVRRTGWSIGVKPAAAAIAVALAVCGAWPASADDMSVTGNRVFFRGGYAALSSNRANEVFTSTGQQLGAETTSNDGSSGYYVGGGLDLMLSRDAWGMMKDIAVLGEIGVEFKRWDSTTLISSQALTQTTASPSKVQMTMLTVDIAPKIKFMQNSNFQPWVIPVGMDFHVISPPSNQTTVLDIGVQFGAGAEYRIWKEFWLGVDGRFHLTSNQTNTVNNFGTVGGYVAIGF